MQVIRVRIRSTLHYSMPIWNTTSGQRNLTKGRIVPHTHTNDSIACTFRLNCFNVKRFAHPYCLCVVLFGMCFHWLKRDAAACMRRVHLSRTILLRDVEVIVLNRWFFVNAKYYYYYYHIAHNTACNAREVWREGSVCRTVVAAQNDSTDTRS